MKSANWHDLQCICRVPYRKRCVGIPDPRQKLSIVYDHPFDVEQYWHDDECESGINE